MTIIKNLVIFLALLMIVACSKGSGKKIRIVDLQGKSHAVKTKVPELNAQILESQGKLQQQENVFADASVNQGVVVVQDVPAKPAEAVVENLAVNEVQKYPTADYKAAEVELADQKAKSQNLPTQDNTAVKVSAGDNDNKQPEVVYDLAKVKKVKRILKKIEDPVNNSVEASSLSGIYVQTGAFSTMENATKDVESVTKFAKSQIEESASGERKIYRVLLGPFPNKTDAAKVIKKLKAANHDAVIVKKK